MKCGWFGRVGLVSVLCVAMATTGCTAAWISVALADLPVLTQMSLNIATLVETLQSGQQISPGDVVAIQNISNEASKDLTLLQTLYEQYRANPNAATVERIQEVIADINTNLPMLLGEVHVKDPVLAARIAAGVNLILTTTQSFAALIPQLGGVRARRVVALPRAADLKRQWNAQVCSSTGQAVIDAELAGCEVR